MPVDLKYYQDLQVTPTANVEQIAQAYRTLSLQLHPLRNPAGTRAFFTDKFAQISEAYEVLSNPQHRAVYDQFGEESLKQGVEGRAGYTFMGNHFKIFFDFFGSENPWFDQIEQVNPMDSEIAAAQQQARAADVEVAVKCSLFEFYNGALKEVEYKINKLQGIDEQVEEDLTIMITIKPGYGEHTTLRFSKMGNHSFGAHPSDLVIKFTLVEPTGGFVRQGDDLHYFVNLTLVEALEFKPVQIKIPDGRSVLVTPNEMITPQTHVCVEGEGMPAQPCGNFIVDCQEQLVPLQDRKKGNLIVKYNIEFPKKVLAHHRETILAALQN